MAPTWERLILVGAVGFALLAIVSGYCLAHHTGDHHWMNRAGAAIVTAEGIIVLVEFLRRERLQRVLRSGFAGRRKRTTPERDVLKEDRAMDILEGEIRRAESHVVIIAVLLAMTGEILHGFGDLLFEALFLFACLS